MPTENLQYRAKTYGFTETLSSMDNTFM
jgi:hypothetical protein